MKKIFLYYFIILFLIVPVLVLAQTDSQFFQAEVTRILEEKQTIREDGSNFTQQDLSLRGLEGEWEGKNIVFNGIGELEVITNNYYEPGDKVMVSQISDAEGNCQYYITDYVRHRHLYWLGLVFVILILVIGKMKGLRALTGLIVSFIIIMKLIVPRILAGSNPMLISILGSIIILLVIVYLTEGANRKSNLAMASIVISLIITGIISIIFTNLTKLTGLASEEIMFLVGSGQGIINFKGLLLAGIIISTLGILDDVVISQLASIEQIKLANPNLSYQQVYQKAMSIGVSHMSSMINTLFLVYAGASLPLLLLFTINEPPFLTFTQIINHEALATEIVRAFCGSIGLILSVPIANFLGSWWLKVK